MHCIAIDRYYPNLNVTSEEFGAENVTVTVKWAQQAGAVYHVRVVPPVPSVSTAGPGIITSYQLTISYNSEYNVSVDSEVIISSCGFNVTAFMRLYYGEMCLRAGVNYYVY